MSTKCKYARYTFAFAADLQTLADEKHVKVLSFSTSQSKSKSGKSYDVLNVSFLVRRKDREDAELEEVTETTEDAESVEE